MGKTHLAIALAVKAAEAGHRVMFIVMNNENTDKLGTRLEREGS